MNIRAAQGTSYYEMVTLSKQVAEILLGRSEIDRFAITVGGGSSANTARFSIQLKPRAERQASAAQIVRQIRPQLSRMTGFESFPTLPPAINIGGRASNSSYQLIVQGADTGECTSGPDGSGWPKSPGSVRSSTSTATSR